MVGVIRVAYPYFVIGEGDFDAVFGAGAGKAAPQPKWPNFLIAHASIPSASAAC